MFHQNSKRGSSAAIVAVTLFLFFDFTALALNFWLSWKIEKQAVAINLAGRQRMLSQRMAKVLLQLEDTLSPTTEGAAGDPPLLLNELRLTVDLFDKTLQGFAVGGTTRGGTEDELYLEAVTGAEAQKMIAQALQVWTPYRATVVTVLNAPTGHLQEVLPSAVTYAKTNNLVLLGLMNKLTSELEQLTQREASQIRLYQGIAFLLALINFIGAFVLYSRRIRHGDKQENLLDEVINKVAASVIVLDKNAELILKVNETSEALFSYASGELSGMPIANLLRMQEDKLVGVRKNNTMFLAELNSNEVSIDGEKLFIQTITDITERQQTEAHLNRLAYHDLLTLLPNRLLFDDRLQVEIARAHRQSQKLGILFIDLDKFKPINDTFGHQTGDLLLQAVASRLKGALRESDTISRRGGDEFTAIISDIKDSEYCGTIAKMIISELENPYLIKGNEHRISASIGIAVYPEDGVDVHGLIAHADAAMYYAKQQGRGRYQYFSDTLPPSGNWAETQHTPPP